jgi:hypothetical protein
MKIVYDCREMFKNAARISIANINNIEVLNRIYTCLEDLLYNPIKSENTYLPDSMRKVRSIDEFI